MSFVTFSIVIVNSLLLPPVLFLLLFFFDLHPVATSLFVILYTDPLFPLAFSNWIRVPVVLRSLETGCVTTSSNLFFLSLLSPGKSTPAR